MPFFSPAQLKALKRGALAKTRQHNLKLKGIGPPLSIEAQYLQSLNGLIKALEAQIRGKVVPILSEFESDYIRDASPQLWSLISDAIDGIARQPSIMEEAQVRIVTRMARGVEAFNRRKFITDIRKAAGVNLSDIIKAEGAEFAVEQGISANVDLITTIPDQYLESVKRTIQAGIDKGDDFFSIRRSLLGKISVPGRSVRARARFIARDQVAKLNGQITKIRQEKIGVTHYFWRTSEDERVRPTHEAHQDERFAWDSPPADTGHPGQDYQCRCVAQADLSQLTQLARSA